MTDLSKEKPARIGDFSAYLQGPRLKPALGFVLRGQLLEFILDRLQIITGLMGHGDPDLMRLFRPNTLECGSDAAMKEVAAFPHFPVRIGP